MTHSLLQMKQPIRSKWSMEPNKRLCGKTSSVADCNAAHCFMQHQQNKQLAMQNKLTLQLT
jgi:hypothetical protein